jgi:hypothetical protein
MDKIASFNDFYPLYKHKPVFDLSRNWIAYPCIGAIPVDQRGNEINDFSDAYVDSAINIQREVGKVASKVVEGLKIVGESWLLIPVWYILSL